MVFIYPCYVLKNVLKRHALCIRPFPNTCRVSMEKTPTTTIKRRAIKGNEKSPRRVLTSSPVTQKTKLKAKHRKNNFKKMVQSPNSSNSDKNDARDCCK
jgi:hypothetical protein